MDDQSHDLILQYLKDIVENQRTADARLEKYMENNNTRIGVVEKWQANVDGKVTATSVFTVFTASVISFIISLFKSH